MAKRATDRLTPDQRSKLMARIKTSGTEPELRVRSLLRRLGFRSQRYNGLLPGRPDIVLSRKRIVLFVHGCFWHGHSCPKGKLPVQNAEFWNKKIVENKARDRRTKRELVQAGWRVLTVWQCALKEESRLSRKLQRALSG